MDRSTLLLAATLAVSGCSFPLRPSLLRLPQQPVSTPNGWYKISSDRFTLVTDLSRGDALEAAQQISGELAGVRAAFGNPPPRFEHPLVIVVYSNGLDFEARFGRGRASMTRLDPKTGTITLSLWGQPTRWVHHNLVGQSVSYGSVLRQTLSHVVLSEMLPPEVTPRWLLMGMGGYIETYAWSDDGKSIELGAANATAYEDYRRARSIGFTDLIAPPASHPGQEEAWAHAWAAYAWALMFTALHEHPQGMAAYLDALASGSAADPTLIFDRASPDAIDKEVEHFITTGRYDLRMVPVQATETDATMAAATEPELAQHVPPANVPVLQ